MELGESETMSLRLIVFVFHRTLRSFLDGLCVPRIIFVRVFCRPYLSLSVGVPSSPDEPISKKNWGESKYSAGYARFRRPVREHIERYATANEVDRAEVDENPKSKDRETENNDRYVTGCLISKPDRDTFR